MQREAKLKEEKRYKEEEEIKLEVRKVNRKK
jgi:hypothetical protein